MPTAETDAAAATRSPALVVLAAWAIPGAGYFLLGENTRGLTVGLTIILLFLAGLVIGGIRVLEVPGYGPHGQKLEVVAYRGDRDQPRETLTEDSTTAGRDLGWVMTVHPIDEIRNKPWSIAQVMTGPLGIAGAVGSVLASERPADGGPPAGARSHARVNEIGVLYTAVAGMLNLLAIIDAAHRAGQVNQ